MRLLRASIVVLAAVLVIGGCGDGSADEQTRSPAEARAAARFDGAIAPADVPSLILRIDERSTTNAADVLRRVAGFRVVESDLPARDVLVIDALAVVGVEVDDDAAEVETWLGDEVGLAVGSDGIVMWAHVASGATKQARAFASSAREGAVEVHDGVLYAAPSAAALTSMRRGDSLDTVAAWKQTRDARGRSGAMAVVSDGRQVAVAGVDDDGFWLDGRSGRATSTGCAIDDDATTELGRLPLETSLAVAPFQPRRGDDIDAARRELRPMLAPVARAGDSIGWIPAAVDASLAQVVAIARRGPDVSAFGVVDRTSSGRFSASTRATRDDGLLRDDPGFATTLDAAGGPHASSAAWVDVARLVRSVSQAPVARDAPSSLERSVVATLGEGIDGALAWRACPDRIGARVAIPE